MTQIQLPGLIDVHTHLRVPGGEHKEDFATGTAAALAGGVTMVLGMPNTSPPIATAESMRQTRRIAAETIRCDMGLYLGAAPAFTDELPAAAALAVALKIYLNDTFGDLRVDDLATLRACFATWDRDTMIAMHAEKQSVAVGIGLAAAYQRPVHFCHISRRQEIELIADAKMAGLPITCEVTPHHLFLSQEDAPRLGTLGDMRPVLGTKEDVAALWQHINDVIDCIATDHAPHTLSEKGAESPPPGVPGLETSLPLMLTAVHDGRLELERLMALMADNPRRIFGLPAQANTHILVDIDAQFMIGDDDLYTKCGWTPFAGMTAHGELHRVVLRGKTVFENGKVVAAEGSGQLIPTLED